MTDKAVIVVSFPEPDDSIIFGTIIKKTKDVFEDMPEVKVYAAINDASETILGVVEPREPSESNLVEHAKRELALAGNDEDFNKSIIKAVEAFASYGHSGGSASIAIPMLNAILQFKNLTPLTNDPEEWNHITKEQWDGEKGTWQNKRNPEAFSDDGGKTYYLLSDRDQHKGDLPTYISGSKES